MFTKNAYVATTMSAQACVYDTVTHGRDTLFEMLVWWVTLGIQDILLAQDKSPRARWRVSALQLILTAE